MRSYILIFLMGLAVFQSLAQIPTPTVPVPETGSPAPESTPAAGPATGATATAAAEAPADASATPTSAGGFVANANYLLRPGDAVSFQIKEDIIWNPADVPKTLTVTDSGELDIPYIGRVMAVNKTCKQVADEITTNLLSKYYNQATVTLSLNLANRVFGRVYIWGAVRSQGPVQMEMNEHLTAGEAILKAGGLSDFANKKNVKLVRAVPGPDGDKIIVLDMVQILEKGHVEEDVPLEPGDHILVSSKFFNF